MQTTIVKTILTDESETYSVVFVDGSSRVEIGAATLKDATQLHAALSAYALYATVS
jgi:hypothetical protein